MTTSGALRTRRGEQPASEPLGEASDHRSRLFSWSYRVVIVLVPLAAVGLVVPRYRHTAYFYDEWSMLERTIAPSFVHAGVEPFNGHLYFAAFLTYRAQLGMGLHGHALVWTVFCMSLVACNVAVALALWAARVPALAAVVAGAVITYFGPAAQLMTLEFQFGMVAAVALSFFAAFIALRNDPSRASAAAIAVVLILATTFDSGSAAGGAVFVAVLLALRGRDRWTFVALAPPAAALGAYLVINGTSPTWPAPIGTELSVGAHLVLLAAGGLAGGGLVTGVVVLVAAGCLFAYAIAAGRMSRDARHCLTAGSVAALVLAGLIATSRAGIVKNDYLDFNRYTGLVAFFLLFALLVPAVAIARDLLGARARRIGPATAVVLVLVFVGNLAPLHRYRTLVEGWQTSAHSLTLQASQQLERGCPGGRPVNADGLPLGALGPQLPVALLQRLEARAGKIHTGAPVAVSAPVRDAICPP
jgi:hypothetical protein